MFPVTQLGPLSISTSSLVLVLGLLSGQYLAAKWSRRFEIDAAFLDGLIFRSFFAGLVGGRLGYLLSYPQVFLDNPLTVVSLSPLLFLPAGALLAAMLMLFIYTQRKGRSAWQVLDTLTPMLAVIALAVPLAQFASGDGFGTPTTAPWGVAQWDARRHPVQLYHLIGNLVVFAWLFSNLRNPALRLAPGEFFLTFCLAVAATAVLVDGFRESNQLLFSSIRTGQVAAFGIVCVTLWTLLSQQKKKPQAEASAVSHIE